MAKKTAKAKTTNKNPVETKKKTAKTRAVEKKKPAKKTVKSKKKVMKTQEVVKKGSEKLIEPKDNSAQVKKSNAKKISADKKAAVEKIVKKAEEIVEQASKPRKRRMQLEILAGESLGKIAKKWDSLQKKAKNRGIKAETYNMRKKYEPQTPIQHKVLGWGFILNNINDRLEVLFEDGIKYLISNYK